MSGEGEREAEALARNLPDDQFEFRLAGGRGFILDFDPEQDAINLEGLGLTPWDLLVSTSGGDLVLSFEGGEVVLKGAGDVDPSHLRFVY